MGMAAFGIRYYDIFLVLFEYDIFLVVFNVFV